MSKLYPPIVEASLPAIYTEENNIIINIPFYMNPTVGGGDVEAMSVIIKTVTTNTLIKTFTTSFTYNSNSTIQTTTLIINKNTSDNESILKLLKPGQYYKIQLAFINKDNEIGYYSSTGITKYVHDCSCEVEIKRNNILYECIGNYECTMDSSEKVYSYNFTLKDNDGNIIDTSGTLLHNINNDTETTRSIDIWRLTKILECGEYVLTYTIYTTNGFEKTVYQELSEEDWAKGNWILSGAVDKDKGCVSLSIDRNNSAISLWNGEWIIGRSSSKDPNNIIYLNTIYKQPGYGDFVLNFFQDYTIEQGVAYNYYAYNGHLGVSCNVDNVDFEHMFLFDGERQLCIKYNPKVASFKTTILETKIDTIGGKYPFFFRNGNVGYKEFSISGLISITMDENGGFLSAAAGNQKNRSETPGYAEWNSNFPTNLTSDNFYKERDFKLKVLEWLTDGKPKLFRSPSEGNYIVRLMNVSLSPNDTLGRMLHTFNCTAYEIADYNEENLRLYGFYSDEWR